MKIEAGIIVAQKRLNRMIKQLGLEKSLKGYKVVVKNVINGHCRTDIQYISIPLWAFDHRPHRVAGRLKTFQRATGKETGLARYYLCHEAAHAITPYNGHGPQFMKVLIKICPPSVIHHECQYKPTAAAAAGIKPKKKRRISK
jgi:hypothetical protein